jgi:uncharacterized membrane protein
MCIALTACTAPESSLTTLAASDEPLAAKPGGTAPYTVTDLRVPVGYDQTEATDVNDAALVVGNLLGSNGYRGFARVNGTLASLAPVNVESFVRAVSNGNPAYAVGWIVGDNNESQPARWAISGTSLGDAVILENSGYGVASGVNDQGEVVGGRSIWSSSGALVETVDPPAGFTSVELSDINNVGSIVLNATVSATSADRAFLRRSSGETILLAPPAGMEAYFTYADAVSEQTGDVVYVAGKVQLDETTCYAARWTVNVATGSVTALTVRLENTGSAWGVSTAGTFVGHQGQGWTSKPFAWTLAGSAIGLPMPKGGKNGHLRAISPNGKYVVGFGEFSGFARHAVLWSGNGP